MSDPRQLPLPLPVRQALGREDYFVSDTNALATALVDDWRNWPSRRLLLTGPEASGKTHLAHVWAAMSGARLTPALDLAHSDIPDLAHSDLCVEDIHLIAGQKEAEDALFHLHNLIHAQGRTLLLTSAHPAKQLPLALPDLASRLQAIPAAALTGPDDTLLTALLAKQFNDRQIVPAADVLPYLARVMPRSFTAVRDIVSALDKAALSRPGGVTRPLAKTVLDRILPRTDTH